MVPAECLEADDFSSAHRKARRIFRHATEEIDVVVDDARDADKKGAKSAATGPSSDPAVDRIAPKTIDSERPKSRKRPGRAACVAGAGVAGRLKRPHRFDEPHE